MSAIYLFILTIVFKELYALEPPLQLSIPFPLHDTSEDIEYFPQQLTPKEAALGATPSHWDGEIRKVNGVSVVSTVKSKRNLPKALDNAMFTVEYMTTIKKRSVYDAMHGHIVYIYHCDPEMKTGHGLRSKQSQFDYVSELINYDDDTHDGRAVDQVYGYGGNSRVPTTTCDCNVLGPECEDNSYGSSSILVHEFGHTIMDLGIRDSDRRLYDSIKDDIYPKYKRQAEGKYCGDTANEMWACSVETWMGSSRRTDTNPNIQTVDEMYRNLRDIYDLLYDIFGQPARHLVPSLSNVNSLTRSQWHFYDY